MCAFMSFMLKRVNKRNYEKGWKRVLEVEMSTNMSVDSRKGLNSKLKGKDMD